MSRQEAKWEGKIKVRPRVPEGVKVNSRSAKTTQDSAASRVAQEPEVV